MHTCVYNHTNLQTCVCPCSHTQTQKRMVHCLCSHFLNFSWVKYYLSIPHLMWEIRNYVYYIGTTKMPSKCLHFCWLVAKKSWKTHIFLNFHFLIYEQNMPWAIMRKTRKLSENSKLCTQGGTLLGSLVDSVAIVLRDMDLAFFSSSTLSTSVYCLYPSSLIFYCHRACGIIFSVTEKGCAHSLKNFKQFPLN